MKSPRIGRYLTAGVIVLATAGPVAADSALRPCTRACKSETRSCLDIARQHAETLRSSCSGTAAATRQCRRVVHKSLGSARKACVRLRADCRACCRAGGQGPTCPVGTPIDFTPPAAPDPTELGLPVATSGRPILLAIPGAQLEFDTTRKDALAALGACARWITACVTSGHPLDDCARSTLPCGSDMPWEEPAACCAPSCFQRYQEARRGGTEPVAAFDTVYYGADPCMPGVADLLRTGRP